MFISVGYSCGIFYALCFSSNSEQFFVGKFIVSYLSICGEKEYYLACACEEVYMPPSAYVGLYGLTVQSSFLGGNLTMSSVRLKYMKMENMSF